MEADQVGVEQRSPTHAQLHGHACIDCGCELDGLVDAGFVYTRNSDGGRLGWRVKACPHHADGERANSGEAVA